MAGAGMPVFSPTGGLLGSPGGIGGVKIGWGWSANIWLQPLVGSLQQPSLLVEQQQ